MDLRFLGQHGSRQLVVDLHIKVNRRRNGIVAPPRNRGLCRIVTLLSPMGVCPTVTVTDCGSGTGFADGRLAYGAPAYECESIVGSTTYEVSPALRL